jgi:hypothetical protein
MCIVGSLVWFLPVPSEFIGDQLFLVQVYTCLLTGALQDHNGSLALSETVLLAWEPCESRGDREWLCWACLC